MLWEVRHPMRWEGWLHSQRGFIRRRIIPIPATEQTLKRTHGALRKSLSSWEVRARENKWLVQSYTVSLMGELEACRGTNTVLWFPVAWLPPLEPPGLVLALRSLWVECLLQLLGLVFLLLLLLEPKGPSCYLQTPQQSTTALKTWWFLV